MTQVDEAAFLPVFIFLVINSMNAVTESHSLKDIPLLFPPQHFLDPPLLFL